MFGADAPPDFFVESEDIDWTKRVEVQAAIQRSIDHSISSTINLPKGTDSDVVSKIYMRGWKAGLKGITVYVDGLDRASGVLRKEGKERFPHHTAPKRPL